MVARSPPKQKKPLMVAPLSPTLLVETMKKVDQCMARLQELQSTVTGGSNAAGISRSPPRSRGQFKSSVRCKQDSFRIRGSTAKKSPVGKFPPSAAVEWNSMSLPAMLVQETMLEIQQVSKSARDIFETVSKCSRKPTHDDPKTPVIQRKKDRLDHENMGIEAQRKREKQQHVFRVIQTELSSPSIHRARSRINFKVLPPKVATLGKEDSYYMANKVSARNRPWVKKTVLFPNPLFHSSPTSQHQKFCRTRSPVIARKKNGQTLHKFLIKSPSSSSQKFQVKIKSPVMVTLIPSPPRSLSVGKRKSPVKLQLQRSLTPSSSSAKFQVKIKNPVMVSVPSPPRPISVGKRRSPMKLLSTASKLRRSLSPSRLANRLVSPLKSRIHAQKSEQNMVTGLKQRPAMMMPPMVGSFGSKIR